MKGARQCERLEFSRVQLPPTLVVPQPRHLRFGPSAFWAKSGGSQIGFIEFVVQPTFICLAAVFPRVEDPSLRQRRAAPSRGTSCSKAVRVIESPSGDHVEIDGGSNGSVRHALGDTPSGVWRQGTDSTGPEPRGPLRSTLVHRRRERSPGGRRPGGRSLVANPGQLWRPPLAVDWRSSPAVNSGGEFRAHNVQLSVFLYCLSLSLSLSVEVHTHAQF